MQGIGAKLLTEQFFSTCDGRSTMDCTVSLYIYSIRNCCSSLFLTLLGYAKVLGDSLGCRAKYWKSHATF